MRCIFLSWTRPLAESGPHTQKTMQEANVASKPKRKRNEEVLPTQEPNSKKPMPAFVQEYIFAACSEPKNYETFKRWLEEYGDFTKLKDPQSGHSFLKRLIQYDNVQVLQLLHNYNLCLKLTKEKTFTIHEAAYRNSPRCLKFIAEKIMNLSELDVIGGTVAHTAVRNYALESLKTIALLNSELFKQRDNFGCSPMDYLSGKESGARPNGKSIKVREKDFCIKGLQCTFFLTAYLTEEDVKTALYPFNKFHKNSRFKTDMLNLQKIINPKPSFVEQFLEEISVKNYEMAACLLCLANKPTTISTTVLTRDVYLKCLQKGAPAEFVNLVEKKIVAFTPQRSSLHRQDKHE